MAALDIKPVLKFMVEKNGSDLFFSTGAPINIEIEGKTIPVNSQIMTPGMIKEISYAMMSAKQIAEFEDTLEMNFALGLADIGRFRVNVYRQRGETRLERDRSLIHNQISAYEQQVDELIFSLYGLGSDDRTFIESSLEAPPYRD